MFRTIKYHYKCYEIENRLLMFFYISKNLFNSVLYTLRQENFSKNRFYSIVNQ